jgi:hypothetical protein
MKVYDPKALENFKAWAKELKNIEYAKSTIDCLKDSKAIILVTEWQEFQRLSPTKLGSVFSGKHVYDGKNVLWRDGPIEQETKFSFHEMNGCELYVLDQFLHLAGKFLEQGPATQSLKLTVTPAALALPSLKREIEKIWHTIQKTNSLLLTFEKYRKLLQVTYW